MSVGDPLSDMLTRIRNAVATGREQVSMPGSKMTAEVARVMKSEGFIRDYLLTGDLKKTLTLTLRYDDSLEPAIRGLKRVSKSGLRRYCSVEGLPRVLGGLGIAILSTSAGVMSDKEAKAKHTGGEILCTIW
ncbi:MAG TPA: 30S ribosomal protein S8 [Verrucomicrobia bacterium]|nr:30S ribosomal protein S8 [Verrucomicrobiota bacterium]